MALLLALTCASATDAADPNGMTDDIVYAGETSGGQAAWRSIVPGRTRLDGADEYRQFTRPVDRHLFRFVTDIVLFRPIVLARIRN